MIVLTENPVTLNGKKIDYNMKYLSADGDEKADKKAKRKNTWQQIKDSGIGQALLDFGKDKLDDSGGGIYPQDGAVAPEPYLPPIDTTPPKEGWWAKKSTGAKIAIVVLGVAGLSIGGYFILKKAKSGKK